MQNFDLTIFMAIIGALVCVTNILTEVMKQFSEKYIPTNIIVLVISMALTLIAFFAYCQYMSIVVMWYMVVGAIIAGFFVAFAAMFGFDKLKETITKFTSKKE